MKRLIVTCTFVCMLVLGAVYAFSPEATATTPAAIVSDRALVEAHHPDSFDVATKLMDLGEVAFIVDARKINPRQIDALRNALIVAESGAAQTPGECILICFTSNCCSCL